MTAQAQRRRRWLRWIIGVVVGLMVLMALVVGGISVYVHQITAPAMLTLPKVAGETSSAATTDGVWKAGPESIIGWRAQQILLGQQSTLVGRTGKVWGSLTISGGLVSEGSFTADMAAITSSLSETTQRKVFDVRAYPTVKLVLTSPIELGTIPTDGTIKHFHADGILTLHGISHAIHFTVATERIGDSIYVLADITFPFTDWNISVQGVPFWADIQSPGTIEVLLRLTQGEGNPAPTPSSAPSSAGGS